MSELSVKKLGDAPDEIRQFAANGHAEVFHMGGRIIGVGVFEPGWRWSTDVKPLAGTDTCQASHEVYILAGQMHVVMDDGKTADLRPHDLAVISPGHDAWVVGDEACIALDFSGYATYARQAQQLEPVEQQAPGIH